MNYLNELTPESELRFNNLVISPCYRNVLLYNAILDLTTKEFDVLYFLASHPGWAFTKGQVYEAVWGEECFCNHHAVENIIYQLRRKMDKNASNTQFIQTLIGYGYKFIAKP